MISMKDSDSAFGIALFNYCIYSSFFIFLSFSSIYLLFPKWANFSRSPLSVNFSLEACLQLLKALKLLLGSFASYMHFLGLCIFFSNFEGFFHYSFPFLGEIIIIFWFLMFTKYNFNWQLGILPHSKKYGPDPVTLCLVHL